MKSIQHFSLRDIRVDLVSLVWPQPLTNSPGALESVQQIDPKQTSKRAAAAVAAVNSTWRKAILGGLL
jgi:hypothetical protein